MTIDWASFDKYPESTCECRCGTVFRSHCKFVMEPPALRSRKPCPSCGETVMSRATSDPETDVIG
jgi:hypothetical protein